MDSKENQSPEGKSRVVLPDSTMPPRKFSSALISALIGLMILTALTFAGSDARARFHLTLPGPVIALALLAAIFLVAARYHAFSHRHLTRHVAPISRVLIAHLGLLFVPAGVGIVSLGDVLRREWLPLVAALLGTTLMGLATTGWLMQRFAPKSGAPK